MTAGRDVDAVVLAAGFGKRLRPLTDERPKALVPLFGVPLLDHALARLAALRPRRVAVNLHHLPDAVARHVGDGRRHGLVVTLSHETPDILGTGGALRRLEPLLAERFLVVNGDVWFDAPLPALAAALEGAPDAVAALGLARDPARPDLHLVAVRDAAVVSIGGRPGPPSVTAEGWIFAGAHLARRALLDHLPADGFACVVRDGYVPALAAGRPLVACPFPAAAWHDVGTPASYLAAHRALFPRVAEILRGGPGWRGREVAAGLFVDPDAVVSLAARLVPPVVVLAGARVEAGAVVGPRVVVGAGAVVTAGAVVRDSVLWDGAVVGGALEGSIATATSIVAAGS
jgi:NDP-sugar pyrophosphorylase family protein